MIESLAQNEAIGFLVGVGRKDPKKGMDERARLFLKCDSRGRLGGSVS